MAYLPNRGDIVHLDFDPSSGREMKGPHFGLVLSGKVFNQQGLAMICPISQGAAASEIGHRPPGSGLGGDVVGLRRAVGADAHPLLAAVRHRLV